MFQSNEYAGKSVSDLTGAEEAAPVITVLRESAGVSIAQAKIIFKTLFLFVHGYASMFANNSLEYDEDIISSDLERAYAGIVYAAKEDMQ